MSRCICFLQYRHELDQRVLRDIIEDFRWHIVAKEVQFGINGLIAYDQSVVES